jgi:hypothetical protein
MPFKYVANEHYKTQSKGKRRVEKPYLEYVSTIFPKISRGKRTCFFINAIKNKSQENKLW